MGAFDAKRNGIGESHAAKDKYLVGHGEVERFRHVGRRGHAFEGEDSRAGMRAASVHFFAEGEDLAKVFFEFDTGNEGAAAALAVGEAKATEGFESLAGSHAADAHAGGDFLFGGDGLTGLEFAGAYSFEEALLNLVVERDDALAVEGS